MKITLIDDESDARSLLRRIVEVYCPDAKVIGEAHSVQSGVPLLRQTPPEQSRMTNSTVTVWPT
ncbi:MAG: hypothetical protein IPH12_05610 [Saprospirales bacterium]|nr:hypothetical protein [Saprospirales bacterium]MBK8923088.1 hypothetical protein [Saprospirales bacterium]